MVHKACIRGITSFKCCHTWFSQFSELCGSCLQAATEALWGSRFLNRPSSYEGTWDTLEDWVLSLDHSMGLVTGMDVATLANQTNHWGVTRTFSSSSARIPLKVSLLSMGRLPRSGIWSALSVAPLTVLTVPGSTSSTSPLSWDKLWGGEVGGDCGWGLLGDDLNTAWYSPSEYWASSTPSPVLPPSPLLGAAFAREQPLAPCGPAPLLLFAPCSASQHPEVEPFLEHLLQPPTGTVNYHGVCG